jgi:hypothetical protein
LPRADLIDFDSFFENKVESEIEQRPMNIALCCSPDERSDIRDGVGVIQSSLRSFGLLATRRGM